MSIENEDSIYYKSQISELKRENFLLKNKISILKQVNVDKEAKIKFLKSQLHQIEAERFNEINEESYDMEL